jgi:peroxiredoxin
LADYRDHYQELRAAGANMVATSVDPPEKSEQLRRDLGLPFSILCDTERRLIRDWNIYNPREGNGIAKPALFVIDRGRVLLYAAVDGHAKRVPASEVIRMLQTAGAPQQLRRKAYIPRLSDWMRAIGNMRRSHASSSSKISK